MTAPDATDALPATLDPAATAHALEHGAVLRWWQTTAFLRVDGPDAPSLLDGLCTQAVERIEAGRATLGLFLDAKAKVIAPAILHRAPNDAWVDPRTAQSHPDSPVLLLETLPQLVEPLRAHLAKYKMRAKASIEPVHLSTIALIGEGLPQEPPAPEASSAPPHGTWTVVHGQARPTLAFIGSAEACAAEVHSASAAGGFPLADADAVEADRIEAGVAGLHDLLPGRMPAEVGGMTTAVALDAGCYLGQEPVARLHYRGHANRTLRRLVADATIAPDRAADPDAALALHRDGDADDARPVGRITTWATRPDGAVVALAVLRRETAGSAPLRLAGTDLVVRPVDAPPD